MKTSVQKKLLKAFLVLFCIAFAVALGLFAMGLRLLRETVTESSEALGVQAAESSETLLTDQAVANALSFAREKAGIIQGILDGYTTTISTLADSAAYIYAHPQEYPYQVPLSTPQELLAAGLSEGRRLQWVASDPALLQGPVRQEAALIANTQNVMEAIFTQNKDIYSLYIATASGSCLFYDDTTAAKEELLYFDARERGWYVSAAEQGGVYISDVYEDLFSAKLMITVAAPVYSEGALMAVCGMDICVDSIDQNILDSNFGGSGYVLLLNDQGGLICAEGMSAMDQSPLDFFGDNGPRVLKKIVATDFGYSLDVLEGQQLYVIHAPIVSSGWKLVIMLPMEDIVAAAHQANVSITQDIEASLTELGRVTRLYNLLLLAVALALLAAFIPVILRVCRRIATPIVELSQDVRTVGQGQLEYRSSIHTGDEIEALSQSFEQMTVSLRSYIDDLTVMTAEKERIGAELDVATQIQIHALPCVFPPFPERREFELYASMVPAREVGGDFYDFFLVDQDHLALVIADVSGKGIPAALFMMTAKTLIKTLAQSGLSPERVMTEANTLLCEGNSAGMFVTLWLGVLEISTRCLTFVNAGHNPPLLGCAGQGFRYLKAPAGFVLAGMEGMVYKQQQLELPPGATLFLYTDGVVEATDSQERLYGEERLQQALDLHQQAGPEELLAQVSRDVDSFIGDAPQFDDITMLAIRLAEGAETGAAGSMSLGPANAPPAH